MLLLLLGSCLASQICKGQVPLRCLVAVAATSTCKYSFFNSAFEAQVSYKECWCRRCSDVSRGDNEQKPVCAGGPGAAHQFRQVGTSCWLQQGRHARWCPAADPVAALLQAAKRLRSTMPQLPVEVWALPPPGRGPDSHADLLDAACCGGAAKALCTGGEPVWGRAWSDERGGRCVWHLARPRVWSRESGQPAGRSLLENACVGNRPVSMAIWVLHGIAGHQHCVIGREDQGAAVWTGRVVTRVQPQPLPLAQGHLAGVRAAQPPGGRRGRAAQLVLNGLPRQRSLCKPGLGVTKCAGARI